MAFGFPPKYIQDIPIEGMEKYHFLIIAIEVAFDLNWKVLHIDESGFVAHVHFSWRSWSEEVRLEIGETTATLRSECTGSQLLDFGKNKMNIELFLNTLEQVKERLSKEEVEIKYTELRKELRRVT